MARRSIRSAIAGALLALLGCQKSANDPPPVVVDHRTSASREAPPLPPTTSRPEPAAAAPVFFGYRLGMAQDAVWARARDVHGFKTGSGLTYGGRIATLRADAEFSFDDGGLARFKVWSTTTAPSSLIATPWYRELKSSLGPAPSCEGNASATECSWQRGPIRIVLRMSSYWPKSARKERTEYTVEVVRETPEPVRTPEEQARIDEESRRKQAEVKAKKAAEAAAELLQQAGATPTVDPMQCLERELSRDLDAADRLADCIAAAPSVAELEQCLAPCARAPKP